MAKGSQKWIQICCNGKANYFNEEIFKQTGLSSSIEWLSPLAKENYVEYRDNAFLKKLGIITKSPLKDFWPKQGPSWDALGKASDMPILVEAKAHIAEAISPPTRATINSFKIIENALGSVKDYLKVNPEVPWHLSFYQYANRVAHLYYLRVLNGINAHLLFVNFINDSEMKGPENKETWDACYKMMEAALGLKPKYKLSGFVHHAVIDTNKLG